VNSWHLIKALKGVRELDILLFGERTFQTLGTCHTKVLRLEYVTVLKEQHDYQCDWARGKDGRREREE
jgi:hypothetical protein